MALLKCIECGRDVSTSAQHCPHCGAPPPKPSILSAKSTSKPAPILQPGLFALSKPGRYLFGILAILLLSPLLIVMVDDPGKLLREKTPSSRGPDSAAQMQKDLHSVNRISGGAFFGCTSRDDFEKLLQFALQKDQQAYAAGLTVGLATGQCVKLTAGEEIFIADSTFTGLVKVRRRGQFNEYWTVREATM